MDQSEIDAIVSQVMSKITPLVKGTITKMMEDLDIPDTRNLATKKLVTDALDTLRNGFNDEFKKRDEAITKIATDTDTKIKELTPPKSKPWWGTVLDFED